MGCPSHVLLGQDLVFSICTHDPDTGVLTDADSAPAYRVYENETATAILTGTMSKLDDANTTGFYTELINCTVANGFEVHKNYTVYIEATVDADQGGISYAFNVAEISGPGVTARTYTVSDTVGTPLNGVQVWIATDTGMTNIIWVGSTNVLGVAVDAGGNKPYLPAGTFYFWRIAPGYSFTNPDTEVFA